MQTNMNINCCQRFGGNREVMDEKMKHRRFLGQRNYSIQYGMMKMWYYTFVKSYLITQYKE